MGSGTKGNSTEQNVVYSFQAQNAIDKQDWGSASMWLGMIDDPFTSMMVQQNLNDAQQKQMAKQQVDFDKQMADMKAQYAQRQKQQEAERQQQIQEFNQQQVASQQVTNQQQKADVSADSYVRADVKRNAGNLTTGHASGALTAKKTLQGFGGGDEDLQAKEQWY